MKVVFAANWWYRRGGLGAVMLSEASALEAAGVEVTPFAAAHPENLPSRFSSLFPPFVETAGLGAGMPMPERSRAALKVIYNREAAAQFGAVLDLSRPDLIHVHGPARQLSPSILRVAAERRIPVVMTLHDYALVCPQGQLLRGERIACVPPNCVGGNVAHAVHDRCVKGSVTGSGLAAVENLIHRAFGMYVKQASLLIAPSQFLSRLVATAPDVPTSKIRVVPNGIEPTKRPLPLPDHGGFVLFAARLAREKGLQVVIEAARLRADIPFVIAGDGPLAYLSEGAPPNVRFIGAQTEGELELLRADSAVAVSPSTWYENAPISVLESLRAARPIVLTDLGGQPELVQSGGGVVVPVNDAPALSAAIGLLWDDRDVARRSGAAGRESFETRYTTTHHVRALLRVYQEAIANARAA